MKKSVKKIVAFIQKEYINDSEMASPDMSTGIRDLLTDLTHLCDLESISIRKRLEDALEVYEEELTLELENKTGMVG